MSDLISRNAIIQMFNTVDRYVAKSLKLCDTDKIFPQNEVYIVDDMYEALDQLPSVQSERKTGRWIPVSERQPDVTGLYLVTATVYLDNEPSGYTTSAANWSNGRWLMEGVKAWRPLPDPWEVEND